MFYGFLLLFGELFFLADGTSEYLNVMKNYAFDIEVYFDFNALYAADWAKQGSCLQVVFVLRFACMWHGFSRCKMLRVFKCLAEVLEHNVRFH